MTENVEATESVQKAAITLTHLQHALKVVSAAVERTTTIPILQAVRLEQLPEGLAIEATNLDVCIRALVPESGGPIQPIVIPAERFMGYAKLLTGEDVKLSSTDRRVTLQCGRARAVLPVLAAKNWPSNEVLRMGAEGGAAADGSITLKQGDLARALKFAMLAVSAEESRYTLNGVLLQGDGTTLKLVATNGHVLVLYSLPCEDKINLLMPSRLIKAVVDRLADADEGVDLWYNDHAIRLAIAGETPVTLAGLKIKGQFPNWEAVFPKDKGAVITVDAKTLLASLERCALLSDNRSGLVILTFEPGSATIKLNAASAEAGEAEETVDCQGSVKEALRIGICGDYLTSVVKKLDGEVHFVPKDNQSALLIKATPHEGESLGYVIMPMRI